MPLVIFSKTIGASCKKVKRLFAKLDYTPTVLELDTIAHEMGISNALLELTGEKTVPFVFIRGEYVGGYDEVKQLFKEDKLALLIEGSTPLTR